MNYLASTQAALLGLTLLATASARAGDCAKPSAEVVRGVVIRVQPTSDSDALGLLLPGQNLPVIGDAVGWSKVRTVGGSPGFVSKRWTELYACTADNSGGAVGTTDIAPMPLLEPGRAVKWWFVFKHNAAKFPECRGAARSSCPFGGTVGTYEAGQQFIVASSENPTLRDGDGCLGMGTADPVGATYDQIYFHHYHFVLWND